jgi:2,5-diamino-6-(ribosylamino)-4(3H)-pyrimidinone 5'-phosphate reductase
MLKVWDEWHHTHPSDRGDSIVRQPWIICGDQVSLDRIAELEGAGARVIPVPLDPEGQFLSESRLGRLDQKLTK